MMMTYASIYDASPASDKFPPPPLAYRFVWILIYLQELIAFIAISAFFKQQFYGATLYRIRFHATVMQCHAGMLLFHYLDDIDRELNTIIDVAECLFQVDYCSLRISSDF